MRHARPGKHYDEHGLILRVRPTGSKHWVQRIVIRGKRRDIGLGSYPLVSLAEARDLAFENRKLARAGGDPVAERKLSNVPIFSDAAAAVIELHAKSWKDGGKNKAQWEASLRDYAMPRLADRRVDEISPGDVMEVLLPIWSEKHVTAKRVRQRIGAIMKWCVAQGYRTDNPAGDAIGAALPKNGDVKKHHRALPYAKVADAVAKVRDSDNGPTTRLALEFLIFTAARSGEIRHATWDEIDMEAATWTVPAERMKAKREHRVPLSSGAMRILEKARKFTDRSMLLFPSSRGGPMSSSAFSKLLHNLKIEAVPHGFRSSFRDWAAELTDAPRAVMEAALAHVVENKVEAAYARSDLFERRQNLMEAWAAYLSVDPSP